MAIVPHPEPARGLMDSLRALAGTLNEALRVRGALFALELGEEVERHKRMLVLGACAAAFLHMSLVLASVLVAAAFWDSYRLTALAAMAALYFVLGCAAVRKLAIDRAANPVPFAGTRSELDQDLAGLSK